MNSDSEESSFNGDKLRAVARFNARRWLAITHDPDRPRDRFRIETDKAGQEVRQPRVGFSHARMQTRIARELTLGLSDGRASVETPISTEAGIRIVDASWVSLDYRERYLKHDLLLRAPQICVEVLTSRNPRDEVGDRPALYFAAGAEEVWLCGPLGNLSFFLASEPTRAIDSSRLCPSFPEKLPVE